MLRVGTEYTEQPEFLRGSKFPVSKDDSVRDSRVEELGPRFPGEVFSASADVRQKRRGLVKFLPDVGLQPSGSADAGTLH